ncbi:MAG: phosphatase PAP2 family protein [Actinobacteria bacterium]|nr:phosphatase PAP2 family protein [Actinomycetota bacterium]
MDASLQRWIVEHRWGPLDPILEGLTYVGSFGIVWLVLAVALSGFSWRRPWRPVRVAVAILLAEMVSGLLKAELDRDRPPVADPDPEPLVGLPATNSFPSGHATVSFACATVLALTVPRLRWALFALAGSIAFSRVYVGVHYPLDVLAGAVLGAGVGLAVRSSGRLLRRAAT